MSWEDIAKWFTIALGAVLLVCLFFYLFATIMVKAGNGSTYEDDDEDLYYSPEDLLQPFVQYYEQLAKDQEFEEMAEVADIIKELNKGNVPAAIDEYEIVDSYYINGKIEQSEQDS